MVVPVMQLLVAAAVVQVVLVVLLMGCLIYLVFGQVPEAEVDLEETTVVLEAVVPVVDLLFSMHLP